MNIVQQCEESTLSCVSTIFLSIYGLGIFLFSIVVLSRIYQVNKVTMELMPILLCLVQSLLHLIQYIFYENNRLQIITLYIQILIFTLIGSTFVQLCYSIKTIENTLIRKRIFIHMELGFYCLMFIGQIITLCFTNNYKCDDLYYLSMLLIMIQLLVTGLLVTIFGNLLLNMIKRVSKVVQFKTLKPNNVVDSFQIRLSSIEPTQLKERRSQIKVVLDLLIITLVLYIGFITIVNIFYSEITCNHIDKIYAYQDIAWVLFGIIQMTPCLVIPFVFGYIPKTQFIYLDETENIIFQSHTLEQDSVVTNLI